MKKRQARIAIWFIIAAILFIFARGSWAEEADTVRPVSPEKSPSLTLVKALMCEEIKDFEPQNETVVFSASLGQAICFTAFDPVPEKTEITHSWFKRDVPDAKFKLLLKPPKWSSFSKIRLRSSDTGPWRVEITDADGRILQTLRFSVTE